MTLRLLQSAVVRPVLFVVVCATAGLAVACGSADYCGEPALAKTAGPENGDAPAADDSEAAPSSSADPQGSDPCDSPALAATSRSTPPKSCNCSPGDPLCSCL